jgi:hypothetical protein
MTVPSFVPPIAPSFNVGRQYNFPTDSMRTVKGYEQVRTRGLRPTQAVSLAWKVLTKSQLDQILGFFESLNGAAGPFIWEDVDTMRTPAGQVPALSYAAGGAIGTGQTYFVAFTWYNSTTTAETTKSAEATLAVPANNQLIVTLPVIPVTPLEADQYRIYAERITGDLDLQVTQSARTWTMPGLPVAGAAAPSTFTTKGTGYWRIVSSPQETKIAANRYSLTLQIAKQVVAL